MDGENRTRRGRAKRGGMSSKSDKRKAVCMLCGKASVKSICDACAQRVQGEHLGKKVKPEKGKG